MRTDSHQPDPANRNSTSRRERPTATSNWSQKYGDRHRLERIEHFPPGIQSPQRVRIYFRRDHFVLQWWDSQTKGTLSDRVNGDLVAAIARAREIEELIEQSKSIGGGVRKLKHRDLVERFCLDLSRRADAGEIAAATARRYRSSLGHYLAFTDQPHISKAFRFAASVNREFQLEFSSYLSRREVAPNGHLNAARHMLQNQGFVLDAVRSMYAWAADPDGGKLLPEGFRNPFRRRHGERAKIATDLFGEPDVTIAMAADFLRACDGFQLRLFAPMILWGLRAAEPAYIFREHVDDQWVKVCCLPELGYATKGRRDKRFPLVEPLAELLKPLLAESRQGLLYRRRPPVTANDLPAMAGASLEHLAAEFRRRCALEKAPTAARRETIRTEVLKLAGGLAYDQIYDEFAGLHRRLAWPAAATLKDLRHLFSTTLANAGIPEFYRRYLMGHSPGKAAIVSYTHLNELKERYQESLERGFEPIVKAVRQRQAELESQSG